MAASQDWRLTMRTANGFWIESKNVTINVFLIRSNGKNVGINEKIRCKIKV